MSDIVWYLLKNCDQLAKLSPYSASCNFSYSFIITDFKASGITVDYRGWAYVDRWQENDGYCGKIIRIQIFQEIGYF